MSADPADPDTCDLSHVVPETELLDNSLQKGRAQLSITVHKHRISKSRCHDNIRSMEADDSLGTRGSPSQACYSPPDSMLLERNPPFSFEALLGRPVGSPEDQEGPLVAPGRGRYHQLTNSSSQETLSSPSSSPSKPRPSAECSLLDRRSRRPESEVLVSDWTQDGPGEPDVPSVVMDTQTRRRFLDLGVTLRRSYIRVTKEKSTRLSGEPSESPSRSSGSPVSFSWFSEGRGTLSPSCSSKLSPLSSPRHQKPHSQWSADLQDFSCPHLSSSPPQRDACRSSQPYHTLSEEVWEEPLSPMSSWTTQQVCQWLKGLSLEQYVPEFSANEVDGRRLLQMDGKALKGLGVLSASDRAALKRRIKDVQSAAEKQRKAVEKMEKQRRRKQEQCSN